MELQLWMALTIATRRAPSFASLLFSFLPSPGLATRGGVNEPVVVRSDLGCECPGRGTF